MKNVKTKYKYHDSLIQSVEYPRNEDVVLAINLCENCSNLTNASVHLIFLNVKNLPEVKETFQRLTQNNLNKGYIGEIVGLCQDDNRTHLIDLTTETVSVEAKGFIET